VELTGLFEYLRADDEIQMNRLVHAIARAFHGDKAQQKPNTVDGEEPIDTTDPKFAEQFKGFTNMPVGRPQRSFQ